MNISPLRPHLVPSFASTAIRESLHRILGEVPARVGLAISGGGDSMFLLAALISAGIKVEAATVDHDLREGSRTEAEWVEEVCRAWGAGHTILTWRRSSPVVNVQADARKARYELLTQWAKDHELGIVTLGHNSDDVAENFMMRKTGIASSRELGGIRFVRPMLFMGRNEIRDILGQSGLSWVDDPSNDNAKYKRVRVRQLLDGDPEARIKAIKEGMDVTQNNEESKRSANSLLDGIKITNDGMVIMPAHLREQPRDVISHVLRAVCRAVGNPEGRFRGERLANATQAFIEDKPFTLCGAMHVPGVGFTRDPGMVPAHVPDENGMWDARWRVDGADGQACLPHRKKHAVVPRAADGRKISTSYELDISAIRSALLGDRVAPEPREELAIDL